ncbi:MAG: hypothetical protein BJ554DRAFT_5713 [Olpidium bornovanus]|uniref:Uncharacterized protein n=1 Tax=Olpidium bornovanus TaxID=278681 RepID=A0A8H8A1X5_9FUNG|nr:MAG: hypothetical protein BJ554DRAFT_5713 [Olpidium bornovanus]
MADKPPATLAARGHAQKKTKGANSSFSPACSLWCVPGRTAMSTLNLSGKLRSSRTRTHRPISVAMEQCGIVGVNSTRTRLRSSSTVMWSAWATFSCSSVSGCSGSLIDRMSSFGGVPPGEETGGRGSRMRTVGKLLSTPLKEQATNALPA